MSGLTGSHPARRIPANPQTAIRGRCDGPSAPTTVSAPLVATALKTRFSWPWMIFLAASFSGSDCPVSSIRTGTLHLRTGTGRCLILVGEMGRE